MSGKQNAKGYTHLPTHIAIVPDGNGRWAERRGLPRLEGHKAGADNMRRMVEYLSEYPIKYVSLYGFSTENWKRPDSEVQGLFYILLNFINDYLIKIHKLDIKLIHSGRLESLPEELREAIKRAASTTKDNGRMVLNVAINYGGRAEIVDAAKRFLADESRPEKLDEASFSKYLYTAGLPDVDLIIRTGDETRLSNFMIWQTAYSEYYFTKVFWPDITKDDIEKALLSYNQRKRRFGGLEY